MWLRGPGLVEPRGERGPWAGEFPFLSSEHRVRGKWGQRDSPLHGPLTLGKPSRRPGRAESSERGGTWGQVDRPPRAAPTPGRGAGSGREAPGEEEEGAGGALEVPAVPAFGAGAFRVTVPPAVGSAPVTSPGKSPGEEDLPGGEERVPQRGDRAGGAGPGPGLVPLCKDGPRAAQAPVSRGGAGRPQPPRNTGRPRPPAVGSSPGADAPCRSQEQANKQHECRRGDGPGVPAGERAAQRDSRWRPGLEEVLTQSIFSHAWPLCPGPSTQPNMTHLQKPSRRKPQGWP
ncbi:collagen alpha-1(I) chain-like [Pan paniscus]|uniref:collagen alpha-1(I) chain-like n=1 Tax=Pan paniscus TaxID=9597 RepID=UPI002436DD9C|nr:collagen alpha-1(I) chain-like [Pan paniscus]